MEIPLFKPMLAVQSSCFDSDKHLFEIKWDGYRCLFYLDQKVRLLSRNGMDMTETFPELGGMHAAVTGGPAVLDGEIVVLKQGLPSFNQLQSRGRLRDRAKIRRAASVNPAVFIAFDLPYFQGRKITGEPLRRRKEILAGAVRTSDQILVSEYILTRGVSFARACASRGLEGVMAKTLTGPYLPGKRSHHWKKIRNTREADLVICGFQAGRGKRKLGALLLGGYAATRLVYQGKVGTGFDRREEKELLNEMRRFFGGQMVAGVPPAEIRNTFWLKPVLVCTVNYLSLTGEGLLRHPVYKGIRKDKAPEECKALNLLA